MKESIWTRWGRGLGLAALALLPWQTRYIFWRPWVGTTESEFGVVGVYATMLLTFVAAAAFALPAVMYWCNGTPSRKIKITGGILAALIATMCFLGTYPTPAHAWILNVLFAALLGYVTYKIAKTHIKEAIIALVAGLGASAVLGAWQMLMGSSPESTLFGLATRNAAHAGDAVLTLGGARILRMYGSFPHPNIFGTALALTYALVRTLGGAAEKKGMIYSASACGALVVTFVVSRSAGLAMACVLLFSLLRAHKKTARVAYSVVCIAPLVWILQFIAPELLAIRGTSAPELHSLSERAAQIRDWKHIMTSGGLLGVGIYGYSDALSKESEVFQAAWAYQPVHNVFMLIIAEIGVWWSAFVAVAGARAAWIFRASSARLLPFFVAWWSLAWFDHALWTSWSGIAYSVAILGLLLGTQKPLALTLDE